MSDTLGNHPPFVQLINLPGMVQVAALSASGGVFVWNNDKHRWEELGHVIHP
jgi:hypothetical protein